ncbi:DUF2946 domain-containing protein [Mixta theicola]|uniref:DUF2946 domain-containing protein n=1 Tax=Mixta theicola TaxID=1458355 RepID=UPI001F0C78A3|nr:DUF2946 domain-containing protein [Mixta theicola]GLR08515.1 hypothetical protein GCM10007905_12340 [Mixta theicola]
MSLIYFAIARSRFPAWLALLAMLLLFIAPVISKSLMAQHGHASPLMTAHMSAMTMAQPAKAERHHPVSMMDDSACGYCVLLIHLPLDSVRLPQLWTLLQAAIPAVPLQLQPFVASWIPIWFRPRGPPVNGFSLV